VPERRMDAAPPRPAAPKKYFLLWWLLGSIAFIAAGLPWVWRRMQWRALLLVGGPFIVLMFAVESLALLRGWWTWNAARLLGPRIGRVPLEECLLYVVVVPVLVVMQLLLQRLWGLRGAGNESGDA
jgi:lycopene cyclase domain-containing protein